MYNVVNMCTQAVDTDYILTLLRQKYIHYIYFFHKLIQTKESENNPALYMYVNSAVQMQKGK